VLVRIVEDPIDEGEALAHVRDQRNGALLVFHGVVRNHHQGKAVTKIDYHCYRAMAEKELRAVAEEAAARHGLTDVAVIHRVGEVIVGEASLLVVAAAPHRRPVFEGILDLVDALKRRVPIWKQEYGPDGTHWVDGVLPTPESSDETTFPRGGGR
jgi:molybdopterin synthase catalytic subunit